MIKRAVARYRLTCDAVGSPTTLIGTCLEAARNAERVALGVAVASVTRPRIGIVKGTEVIEIGTVISCEVETATASETGTEIAIGIEIETVETGTEIDLVNETGIETVVIATETATGIGRENGLGTGETDEIGVCLLGESDGTVVEVVANAGAADNLFVQI